MTRDNPGEISLRNAVKGDADAVTELVNSVYRGENAKKGWTTEADFMAGIRITAEKVREIISRKTDLMILALRENKIVGSVQLENKGSYSLLGMLSVDVNCQGKGIAKLLITACERCTKEVWGLNEIRMKVFSNRTELIDYYKRRNYVISGEREEFANTEEAFGEPKFNLVFEILVKKL